MIKLSKVLLTKSGILTMLKNQVLSTRRSPINSSKTLFVTSDMVMNSPGGRASVMSGVPTRTSTELSRRPRWFSSSSKSYSTNKKNKSTSMVLRIYIHIVETLE